MRIWSDFIFREEVYKRDREDLRGVAELILAKQRNGPIGKIDLVFLHAMTKFENRAEDLGEPLPIDLAAQAKAPIRLGRSGFSLRLFP